MDRRNFLKFVVVLAGSLTGTDIFIKPALKAAAEEYPNWGGMLDDYIRKELNIVRFRIEDYVILDRLTGLMWARNRKPFGDLWPACSYSHAEEIIAKMNAELYGGYSGWRIPGEYDWITVIDSRYRKPALVKGFDIGDITYKFPHWIRKEDKEHRECARLDGAVACLPPKNGILLENGVTPFVNTPGMILPVRTHDPKQYDHFILFFLDWMDPQKRKELSATSLIQSIH
jgi:hypothetical protein